ncbi:MAG: hypothetical protein HYY23_16230 [Verrucomicrobia bacterium]|nr:hypothetical protein [Verrucomicrobiota bacterium]
MKLKVFRNNHARNAKGGGLKLKSASTESTPPTADPKPKAIRIRIHRVRFEFADSTAGQVCIAGTFNGWRPEAAHMIPLGNGCWQKDLGLPSNTYEYCLVVDGEWRADPLAKETVPNPFGGMNSVLKVGQCA